MRNLGLAIAGILGIGVAVWLLWSDGILPSLVRPGLSATDRVEFLRTYFLSWGGWAPLVYALAVSVEVVVAPIPGVMLYAPGGMIFGGFYGGFLSLVGNVAGAGISAALMRGLKGEKVDRFLESEKARCVVETLQDAGVWVILALRINPLTTTDLVSYAAGLTGIPIWKVMLGTALGMAPLCWIQAYLAEELFEALPWLIYPLAVLAMAYVIVAIVLIRKALKNE